MEFQSRKRSSQRRSQPHISDREGSKGREESSEKLRFKVLMIGPRNVGKSSILRKICYDEFVLPKESTYGFQTGDITLKYSDKRNYILSFWDAALEDDDCVQNLPDEFFESVLGKKRYLLGINGLLL